MILQQTQHSIESKARVARAHRAYSCIGRANCNLRLHFGFEKQLKSVSGAADSVKRFAMDDDDDDDDDDSNETGNPYRFDSNETGV